MRVLSNYKKLVEGITTSDESSLGKSSLLRMWSLHNEIEK